MEIRSLTARPILDSRGEWTVEAHVTLVNGAQAIASVPQGKSTGSAEARALPAEKAVRNINTVIAPKLAGKEFHDQASLDAALNKIDGTPIKSKLGANAILAVSIAFLRASARASGMPLWRHIGELYGVPPRRRAAPKLRLFINVINGGLHAGNNLHFQEYLVIPNCKTISESIDVGIKLYHALGETLAKRKGKTAKNLGDEGGYAPEFKDDLEPFRIMQGLVKKMKLVKAIDFGMDAAATDARLKPEEARKIYTKLIRAFRPIYLEDPFGEEDFEGFASFTKKFGERIWIAGDDLTTTNVRRMERAHAEGSVNAVIIKPNQIGSVTEAFAAVRAARAYGWKVVVSHRSGETEDDFIADFAYGVRADGIKLGAPARGERIAKYNRLLAIEGEH
jgi:enolase